MKIVSVGEYYGDSGIGRIARDVKKNDIFALGMASTRMLKALSNDGIDSGYLVPIPSRSGFATDTLNLCKLISHNNPNFKVCDILSRNNRFSQYDSKKTTGRPINHADLGIKLDGIVPRNCNRVILVDNVVDTCETMMAALHAFDGYDFEIIGLCLALGGSFTSRDRNGMLVESDSTRTVVYEGLFLDENYPSLLSRDIRFKHVTYRYRPENPRYDLLGKKGSFLVVGYGNDSVNEGWLVDDVIVGGIDIGKDIAVPHVTLSVSEYGEPVNTAKIQFNHCEPFVVDGTYGFFMSDKTVCFDDKNEI